MIQLKTKHTKLFLLGVLLLSCANNIYGFGSGNAMTAWLLATDHYNFYALASSISIVGMMISLPTVGAMSNRIGLRNLIVFGAAVMSISGICMQFCNNIYLFLVLRFLGSFGTGIITVSPFTILGSVFELNTAMKYYGLIATANAIGCLVGPLLAGVLVDAGMIMLPFAVWIPFMLIALLLVVPAYPNVKFPTAKFDVLGLALLVVASLSFVLWTGLSGTVFPWLSAGLLLPVLTIVCVVLLSKHSAKVENPAVPFYVFKNKRFSVSFLINTIENLVPTCITGYLLAYVLGAMAQSATVGSTTSMPYTIVSALLGLISGRVLAKNFVKNVRKMVMIAGIAACASVGMMSLLTSSAPMAVVWIASGLGGITASFTQTCLTPFFQSNMQQKDFPAAQGMFTFGATCGATLFFSVVGVLVNAAGGEIRVVFRTALALTLLCLVVILAKFKAVEEEA